ncbi:MAG TPA: cache domain-containing protein [Bacteroidales bacterium]|nr:cache domain-containing protein [Bacteroidales bacterium]
MALFSTKIRSISSLFTNVIISITVVLVLLLGVSQIILEYNNGIKEIADFRQEAIEKKKLVVQNEVNTAIDYAKLKEKQIEQELHGTIKERVYEAHAIASNLHKKYYQKYNNTQIQRIILEALRPVRFFNGRGYYFVVDMEGTELLYPVFPQYEGENLLDLTDSKGNKVIQDELEVIRSGGEGFVSDFWPMPGFPDSISFEKTSFVKEFAPLDFYIGAGEYRKNIEQETKENVIEELSRVRYDEQGYIFITNLDGSAVIINSSKYERGDNVLDMEDEDGVKIIREQHKVAKEGGGFVRYKWLEPPANKRVENLSYVKLYEPWGWVVGAWINMDDIDQAVELKRADIYSGLFNRSTLIVLVMIVVLAGIFYLAHQMAKRISDNISQFTASLEQSLSNHKPVKTSGYNFSDLVDLSHSTNNILKERNIAEEKLKRNEHELRLIFDYAPVMLAVLSNQGEFIIYNRQLQNTLGYSASELENIQKALPILFPDKNQQEYAANRILKSAGEFAEYKVVSREGKEMIHNWASFRITDKKIVLFGYDVTELKKAHQELQKRGEELQSLNATKDKFFSIIAHDIRNPLNAMIGFAGILEEEFDEMENDEVKDIVHNILVSSDSLNKLIQNLLEWSRAQMGRLSVAPQKLDVSALILDNARLMKSHAKRKYIKVEVETPENLPLVWADKPTVETIVRNLLSNAVKFTKPNGRVQVKIKPGNEYVTIQIIDNGIGVMEEDLQKLFDPGSKLKKSGTSNEKGTGLGLILVKEFVEINGGTIRAESKIDKGSTFTFTLPAFHKG